MLHLLKISLDVSALLTLLHFSFSAKKQVKWQSIAGILAAKLSQHGNTVMASPPVIRHGDQKIHVGVWPRCSPSA